MKWKSALRDVRKGTDDSMKSLPGSLFMPCSDTRRVKKYSFSGKLKHLS